MFVASLGLALVLVILSVYPVLEYSVLEPAHRAVWGITESRSQAVGTGVYRASSAPTFESVGAPLVVRVTAFSCFALGQLFVIGLPVAMLGNCIGLALVAYVGSLGLLAAMIAGSVSALGIASALPSLGAALLRRGPTAARRARRLAGWSLFHSCVLSGWMATAFHIDANDVGSLVFFGLVFTHIALSIGQALLLFAAARAIETLRTSKMAQPGARNYTCPVPGEG